MLLNHDEILRLVLTKVVENASIDLINGTSIDVTLGQSILVERCFHLPRAIDYRKREPLTMRKVVMDNFKGHVIRPGEFILAQSDQVFNLPDDLSAEYKLKSSMARIGLEHLNAGWCDPGWNGSVLTLEFTNVTRYHAIRIRPGDRIGQVVFFRNLPVKPSASYRSRGRYNGDTAVTGIKP